MRVLLAGPSVTSRAMPMVLSATEVQHPLTFTYIMITFYPYTNHSFQLLFVNEREGDVISATLALILGLLFFNVFLSACDLQLGSYLVTLRQPYLLDSNSRVPSRHVYSPFHPTEDATVDVV